VAEMVNGLGGRAGVEPAGEVALEGVSKRFGPVEAVQDLTLEIHAGEFFSLLGPSGCGKSTTLRLIAGFEEPTTGRIVLGGKDVTRTPPHKRPVNTVFQSYALFPHLKVRDNVAFGLRFHDVSTASNAGSRPGWFRMAACSSRASTLFSIFGASSSTRLSRQTESPRAGGLLSFATRRGAIR